MRPQLPGNLHPPVASEKCTFHTALCGGKPPGQAPPWVPHGCHFMKYSDPTRASRVSSAPALRSWVPVSQVVALQCGRELSSHCLLKKPAFAGQESQSQAERRQPRQPASSPCLGPRPPGQACLRRVLAPCCLPLEPWVFIWWWPLLCLEPKQLQLPSRRAGLQVRQDYSAASPFHKGSKGSPEGPRPLSLCPASKGQQ